MKAWVYLIRQGLVTNKAEMLISAEKEPTRTRARLLYLVKQSNMTIEDMKERFFMRRDFIGLDVKTWEQLFDTEIYRFTPQVIKGGNQTCSQMELGNLIPFTLKVVRK